MKKYKYIHFEPYLDRPDCYVCKNNKSLVELGYIQWYNPWKCYTFTQADSGIEFSADCLIDIADFMNSLKKVKS